MSRILEYISKYDENLTIAQFKEAIELEQISAKQIETEEIDTVKKEFKDVYLKRVYDCDLFGKTLEVYHIEEITDSTKCTDYSLAYFVRGTKIAFSPQDINFRKLKEKNTSDTFSGEELISMQKIFKEDFHSYLQKFNEISNELINLVNYGLSRD